MKCEVVVTRSIVVMSCEESFIFGKLKYSKFSFTLSSNGNECLDLLKIQYSLISTDPNINKIYL